MIRPKGLGRGLDALLSGGNEDAPREALQMLAVGRIRPGRYQPRTRMDETALNELADSIREQGLMQPILVRPVDGGSFEIIAGERHNAPDSPKCLRSSNTCRTRRCSRCR